jgi:RNA polymerase sigma factor (sigma-70 family)
MIVSLMTPTEHTCWTVVRGAAAGNREDRELFVQRYAPVVRTYLEARWNGSPLESSTDDGVQEVFLECFKEGGVLERLDEISQGSFRQFLYGVVRNVALRIEAKRARSRENQAPEDFDFDSIKRREATLSKIFDRAWAQALLDEAVANLLDLAESKGEGARKRVELLHLRFYDGLPIREIARRWQVDAEALHNEYQRARREFKAALLEVITFHSPASPEDAEKEFEEIIAILSD